MALNKPVHFEVYFASTLNWYEISAYPAENGLSVFFKDITERKSSTLLLVESEKRYSELFDLSPMPNWVFDTRTLRFLDVNTAAIQHYGYSREEFLSMTIKNIRPHHGIEKLNKALIGPTKPGQMVKSGIHTHQKKNGGLIQVDIQRNTIIYKGKEAKLIIANDITERLKYITKIETQNERLREISWMQSHIIRAPLVRIMGLIPLLQTLPYEDYEREKILGYLLSSAEELDTVIRNIADKTEVYSV